MIIKDGPDVGHRPLPHRPIRASSRSSVSTISLFVLFDDRVVESVVAAVSEVGHEAIPRDREKAAKLLSADQNCVKTQLFSRFSTLAVVASLSATVALWACVYR